jgi:hypothetical protein
MNIHLFEFSAFSAVKSFWLGFFYRKEPKEPKERNI